MPLQRAELIVRGQQRADREFRGKAGPALVVNLGLQGVYARVEGVDIFGVGGQ